MNSFQLYSHLPILLQNAACTLQGIRLNLLRYGNEYKTIYSHLLESDSWNAEQIKRYKEEQLYNIIDYAYRHCPYYRAKYDAAGVSPANFTSIADLKKFPILTKDEVATHYREMLSDEFRSTQLIAYHTSGTSGKPLNFYWTPTSTRFYWAEVWRARQRFGINRGERHLNFTGKFVTPLGQQAPPYWRYNAALNQYMLNQQHISATKAPAIIDFINRKHFRFFVGYPSIIYTLAVLANRLGLQVTAPPAYIFTSAEKLYDSQRKIIGEVFAGTKIIEHYGFSEQAGCATQCADGFYHEDFEMGHFELADSVQTAEGITGTLLATGFANKAMPFIRYSIGDQATFSTRPCRCGRHTQTIVRIEGRNEDFVFTREGTRLTRLDYWFKNCRHIYEAQIVQHRIGAVVIRIVRRTGYTLAEEQSIRNMIIKQFSPTLDVTFEYVDAIARTRAGKFKFVVNEITPPDRLIFNYQLFAVICKAAYLNASRYAA